jgi:cold shock CspA family protein
MGNCAAREVAELSKGRSKRVWTSRTNDAGKIIVGTIRRLEGRLFVARDDGETPDTFLHESIARRGGLTRPYEGQRVRCAITIDGMGNCAAREVTSEAAGSMMNSGGPLDAA